MRGRRVTMGGVIVAVIVVLVIMVVVMIVPVILPVLVVVARRHRSLRSADCCRS
jgi:small-conductance mechanosensitive channel